MICCRGPGLFESRSVVCWRAFWDFLAALEGLGELYSVLQVRALASGQRVPGFSWLSGVCGAFRLGCGVSMVKGGT